MLNYYWDDVVPSLVCEKVICAILPHPPAPWWRPWAWRLIIAANILLGVAVIPLTFILARQFQLSRELALLAAGIVAIDPTSVRYSVLLAEPLANLLLTIAFVSLLALRGAEKPRAVVGWGLLAGACIALSALTRPAAYLFWIPMALWTLFSKRSWRSWHWSPWLRFRFPAQSYGSSTMRLSRRQDVSVLSGGRRRQVRMLGNDVERITANWRHRHLASTPEMQSATLRKYSPEFHADSSDRLFGRCCTSPAGLFGLASAGILACSPRLQWVLASVSLRRLADAYFLALPGVYFLGCSWRQGRAPRPAFCVCNGLGSALNIIFEPGDAALAGKEVQPAKSGVGVPLTPGLQANRLPASGYCCSCASLMAVLAQVI